MVLALLRLGSQGKKKEEEKAAWISTGLARNFEQDRGHDDLDMITHDARASSQIAPRCPEECFLRYNRSHMSQKS